MKPICITRRGLLRGAAASVAAFSIGCAGRVAATAGLRLIGDAALPHRLSFAGSTVGGLSGLDFDAGAGLWYALSDDRSELGPARFYTLRLEIADTVLAPPRLLAVTTLKRPDGTPYPSRQLAAPGTEVVDPESIRFRSQTRTFLWSSEGDVVRGHSPFVAEATLDGLELRRFQNPPVLRAGPAVAPGAAIGHGPRDNLGFEGLALTPDGAGTWAAMEAALAQDGALPSVGSGGGPCRFTLFETASGQARRQVAYQPDPIPAPPIPANSFADNGVSEILMVDTHRMLVLERAFSSGVGNSLRLYLADTREASDTLALDSLRPGNHQAMAKRRVADFSQLGLTRLDNTEGMAWGPRLRGGGRTLVFVSDDNFNPKQVTQFAAFEFQE